MKKIDYIHICLQLFVLSSLIWFRSLSLHIQEVLVYTFTLLTAFVLIPLSSLFDLLFGHRFNGLGVLLFSIMIHISIAWYLIKYGFTNPYSFYIKKKLNEIDSKF